MLKKMEKKIHKKDDGRYIIFFIPLARRRKKQGVSPPMSELRWNPPQLEQWLLLPPTDKIEPIVLRPNFARSAPPLCRVHIPPRFQLQITKSLSSKINSPALTQPPPPPLEIASSGLYRTAPPAEGVCEVVLYSPPKHEGSLAQLEIEEMKNLIKVWTDRFLDLSAKEAVEYVFILKTKEKRLE